MSSIDAGETSESPSPTAAKLPGAAAPRPGAGRVTGKLPKVSGASSPRSSASGRSAPRRPGRTTPRRVRLTLSRVDPWSVMKIAFLLSVAIGIAFVVMITVLWTVLDGMGVFSNINDLLQTLDHSADSFNIMDYVGFAKVISLSVVIAVIDVVLMTAFATLAAFLYNICSTLVGGVQFTLSDE